VKGIKFAEGWERKGKKKTERSDWGDQEGGGKIRARVRRILRVCMGVQGGQPGQE